MSGIVFKFRVISSPSSPFPLDKPLISLPELYVREADMPSIFGSEKNSKFSNDYISKCFETSIRLLKNNLALGMINGPISKKTFLKRIHQIALYLIELCREFMSWDQYLKFFQLL